MPGEPPTRATHTALVVKEGNIDSAEILEALWPRMIKTPLKNYRGRMIVFRARKVEERKREQMVARAVSYAHMSGEKKSGAVYGVLMLPLFLLDGILSKALCYLKMLYCWITASEYKSFEVRLFTRLKWGWFFVCSQAVARVYDEVADISFGYNWSRVNPDDIDDHCMKNPADFLNIYWHPSETWNPSKTYKLLAKPVYVLGFGIKQLLAPMEQHNSKESLAWKPKQV